MILVLSDGLAQSASPTHFAGRFTSPSPCRFTLLETSAHVVHQFIMFSFFSSSFFVTVPSLPLFIIFFLPSLTHSLTHSSPPLAQDGRGQKPAAASAGQSVRREG